MGCKKISKPSYLFQLYKTQIKQNHLLYSSFCNQFYIDCFQLNIVWLGNTFLTMWQFYTIPHNTHNYNYCSKQCEKLDNWDMQYLKGPVTNNMINQCTFLQYFTGTNHFCLPDYGFYNCAVFSSNFSKTTSCI